MRPGDTYFRKDGRADAVERFAQPAETPPLKESIISGMKAGLIGGAAMALLLARSYGVQSGSPLLPVRVGVFGLTGSSLLAESALGAALGIFLQLIYAVVAGALFGVIVAKLVGKMWVFTAAAVGGTYGLLVWIVGQYVVIAYVAPNVMMLYDQVALAQAHLVYGLCLGLFGSAYCSIRRDLSRRGH